MTLIAHDKNLAETVYSYKSKERRKGQKKEGKIIKQCYLEMWRKVLGGNKAKSVEHGCDRLITLPFMCVLCVFFDSRAVLILKL